MTTRLKRHDDPVIDIYNTDVRNRHFPAADVELLIVHVLRAVQKYVSGPDDETKDALADLCNHLERMGVTRVEEILS